MARTCCCSRPSRVERIEGKVSGLARPSTGLARQRLQRGNPRVRLAG
jgi:hypothetical protein